MKTTDDLKTLIAKRKAYFETRYAEAIKKQKIDFEMVRGEQWDKKKKEQWKEAGLPTLTNNRIKPKISLMKGNQAQNRFYFKCIPNDDVDPNVTIDYDGQQVPMHVACQMLTKELKQIENENDGEYELSDCFSEGVTCGKSYLEPFIDENKEVFPFKKYIKFESRAYNECYPDPDAKKYDLSDAEDWIKFIDISREKLKERFPDKKDLIEGLQTDEGIDETEHTEVRPNDKYNEVTGLSTERASDSPLLLTEYYYYDLEDEHLLGTTEMGVQPIPSSKVKDIEKMYEQKKLISAAQGIPYDYKLFKREKKTWYVCSYCSGEILDKQEMPIDEINVVQYCADRIKSIEEIDQRDIGVVRDLIDQQKSYNTLKSLTLAHTTSSINSGIAYEDGAIDDTDLPKWKKWMSKPGFMGKLTKGAIARFKQLFPMPLNQSVFGMAKDEAQEMDETSLIRPELSGEGGDKSGKALHMMLNQQFMGIHTYFDNFRRTKHLLCRKLVKMICYLKDIDFNMLKIVIDDTVESPTTRYANYLETQELLKEGGQMLMSPFADLIVQGTNLTNKEEWLQRIQEVNEFQQYKQQMAMKAEAEKMAIEDSRKEGLIPKGANNAR